MVLIVGYTYRGTLDLPEYDQKTGQKASFWQQNKQKIILLCMASGLLFALPPLVNDQKVGIYPGAARVDAYQSTTKTTRLGVLAMIGDRR